MTSESCVILNELKCKNNKKENDENDERENHNEKPNADSEKEAEELAKFTLQLTKQLKDIATGKFTARETYR